MGRPRKQQPAPSNSNQKLDALALRIRDRLGAALERNVDRFLDHMDKVLSGQPSVTQDVDVAESHSVLPQEARKALQLGNGQRRPRTCGNCRQTGHRADKCPNPKSDSEDPEPEPKVRTPKRIAWDEQQRLIRLVQETGDKRIMEHLVRVNIGLVHRVARQATPWHTMPYDDIVQEGSIGLMKGIQMFDTSRGLKLSTYATWWIRHYIIRANENNGIIRVPVHSQVTLMKLRKAQKELGHKLGRDATIEELAEETKIPAKKLHLLSQHGRVSTSLDQVLEGQDGERQLHEILADHSATNPDDDMIRIEAAVALADAIKSLPERDQAIIRLRYLDGDGMTLKEIGDMMTAESGQQGISRERVRQLEGQAIRLLKVRLKKGKHVVIDTKDAA